MNPKSILLSNNYFWAREFGKYFSEVHVVTTNKKNIENNKYFDITSLSEPKKSKINSIRILFSVLFKIVKKRNKSNVFVFHHMSVYSVIIIGIPLRIMRIRQSMWFAHSKRSIIIWLANKIVNSIYTPSLNSFPFPGSKVKIIGHGIKSSNIKLNLHTDKRINRIICIGRISPIKNIEKLIDLVGKFNSKKNQNIKIDLFGPVLNQDYLQSLKVIADSNSVILNINSSLSHAQVSQKYRKYRFAYNGMMNSVDKSALEATAEGCLLISPFQEALHLSGMELVYGTTEIDLYRQIEICCRLSKTEETQARKNISEFSRSKNNYKNIAKIISLDLMEV